MTELTKNIFEECSYDELEKVQLLLSEIRKEKKARLESAPTIFKFTNESLEFISANMSKHYLDSNILSFRHLKKFFGEEKNIEQLTVKDIEDFKIHLRRTCPKGYIVYLRNLKASFNRAEDWDYISQNPFNKVKIPQQQRNKPLFLSRSELQIIIDHCEKYFLKEIIIFAFNSGCRIGEIVSIKWSNIDFEKEIITVGDSKFTTKGKKQRFLPFTLEMKNLLKKMKTAANKNFDIIFCKENGFPFATDYISKLFKDAVRAAGLSEDIHFHTLRHSFGSNLGSKGVPINDIKELMGHSSITTTQIYVHTNLENLRKGISKLNFS